MATLIALTRAADNGPAELKVAVGGAVLGLGFRGLALAFLQGAPEAVGLGSRLNDGGAVSNTVDQRLAQPGVGNHRGPFRER
jgi:hypothetical protein